MSVRFPQQSTVDETQDRLFPIRRQLINDLSLGANKVLDKSRQLLLSLSLEDRRRMVGMVPLSLQRCRRLDDVKFLIEECSLAVFDGGKNCALCSAILFNFADRVTMYIDYLVEKRPLKQQEQLQQPMFNLHILASHFVKYTLQHTFSHETSAIADLIFASGVNPNEEINGSTILEWALHCTNWGRQNEWVTYLLDKGAEPCQGSTNLQGALVLAAVHGTKDLYEIISSHGTVSASRREEASTLRGAYELVQMVASPIAMLDMQTVNDRYSRTFCDTVFDQTAPCRTDINGRLKLILKLAQFVRDHFGGCMPSFFARDLTMRTVRFLPLDSGTILDVIDLLVCVVDSSDVCICDSYDDVLTKAIAKCRNNLDLAHLSQLLVAFCYRQLRCGGTIEPPNDWPKVTRILLRCALENTASIAAGVRELESALHRTATLAVAIHMWGHEEDEEIPALKQLIHQLIDQGTFVGLSEILLNTDIWWSSTGTNMEASQILESLCEAACCQLDSIGMNRGGPWQVRPLVCLAARRVHRCVDSDQFCRLPNVSLFSTNRSYIHKVQRRGLSHQGNSWDSAER